MNTESRESIVYTVVSAVAIIGLFIVFSMNLTGIVSAEADPGPGNSGFLIWYVYPHAANPAVTYAANLSTTTAYEYGVALNAAGTKHVPFGTSFDIVVKCRVNVSGAYNTTSSAWVLAWVRANLTCAGLGIAADTAMTSVQITTNAVYMWVNFYINNGGSGYSISHGQTINVTSFKFKTYS